MKPFDKSVPKIPFIQCFEGNWFEGEKLIIEMPTNY